MATSALHVVGLQEPPKNTSGPLVLDSSVLLESTVAEDDSGWLPKRGGGVFERLPFGIFTDVLRILNDYDFLFKS